MGIQSLYRTSRLLGDTRSLHTGVGRRVQRRVTGRFASKSMAGLSVTGLFAYAQFLDILRERIRAKASRPVWVGAVPAYAAGYEFGFDTIAAGARLPPPGYRWLMNAVDQSMIEARGGGKARTRKLSFSRSGIYQGGRYLADFRSFANGTIVSRMARRTAGRASTRMFWGTLSDPNKNILEPMAERAATLAKKNLSDYQLIDKEVLIHSVSTGETREEMIEESTRKALEMLTFQSGGKPLDKEIKRVFGNRPV